MKSSTPSKNPVVDDTLSPTLVDPSLVTVMGVVDGQSPAGPSDLSDKPVEKRKKEEKKKDKKATTSKSRTSRSSHLTDLLLNPPTRNLTLWSKSGRIGSTAWRHYCWPKH